MNISISIKKAQTSKPRFCHLSDKTSEKIIDRSLKIGILPRIYPRENFQFWVGEGQKKPLLHRKWL
jgi:hypothetical protein